MAQRVVVFPSDVSGQTIGPIFKDQESKKNLTYFV